VVAARPALATFASHRRTDSSLLHDAYPGAVPVLSALRG
jgi:hypothetical protein